MDQYDQFGPALGQYVILTEAAGINDHGWIVANGMDSRTGVENVYLQTA